MLNSSLTASVATAWVFSQDLGFLEAILGSWLFSEGLGFFLGFSKGSWVFLGFLLKLARKWSKFEKSG